ncbi:hypothetical protein N7481_001978 [Penicillium waksmanii]|uniref:uncharacterized protein n=1 Tax=Penicillium waksmanii TaxID=69791 RepID=UPI00254964ED|nr:uncharacterized protein N7481_001978 [Penicillium waksmanii]KAJ5995001.1 hypothetical protein N7481_001978 [Penicillium waksmanii]
MEFTDSDPVDWNIEEVVKFLCDSESRPWAEGSNIPFPKPTDLAAALHENFITGEVLLEEVDKISLKDDFGVKALGHRCGIMKAIEWLRIRAGPDSRKSILENAELKNSDRRSIPQQFASKVPPEGDDADLLPLYGDSGSEGQFDEETWEEMQIEAKELQEHANKPTPAEKASLSREECMALIAQHVAQKEDLWKEKHLPKELPKAPKLWNRSHMNGSLEQDKSDLTKRIYLYQKRLEKLKGGLLEVDSKDRAFFLLSCATLDHTIADICLDKWILQILELENCPPRAEPPPRVPKPKPKEEHLGVRDDESLASEMDTDLESSYEESEPDGSESEEDESDFIEVDPEDEPVQDLVDKPHRGLPFTLDSPPPADEQVPSTEPARKRRRIYDNESDGEMTSDTGIFSEVLRRGDIDTVDLTESISIPASAAGSRSVASPSNPALSGTVEGAADAADPDEMQIETPPLNPTHSIVPQDADVSDLLVDSTPSTPVRNVRVKLTMPLPPELHSHNSHKTSRGDNEFPQGLSSIPEDMMLGVDEDDLELFDIVKSLDFEKIADSKDRVQLLAKSILGLGAHEPKLIRKYLDEFMLPQLMDLVHEALTHMQNDRARFPDQDENESLGIMRLAVRDTISQIEKEEAQSMFSTFVERLSKLFNAHDLWGLQNPKYSPGSHSASLATFVTGSKSNAKAKNKTKYAPRTPSNMQREAQVRQEKQEAMRQEREKRGLGNSDPEKQAVNFKEPAIYLHREIGEHVKPHQLAGIQFMWRELIEAKKPQGCLLAHVMGLGKTMQVISLLTTIADAAASDDPQIREQVPEKFHRSQTLVLCPSAVVQNWAEEFALWTPKRHHLGPIWEIMSGNNMEAEERFHIIKAWDERGGVLIISYDLFRIIVLNKSTRPTNRNSLSDEQHEFTKEALLSRPNIVVADEAHRLKNEKSAISQVTSRFKTLSRIAMTGSPLANHLWEYYQMVEWVAPGYLEDAASFKTKFLEPIQSGSYIDSTRQQQRESLCALKILNGILKPKTEFVIRIPLTDLQEAAYNTFVSTAQVGDDVDSKLYTWLAILQLCCNHPQPFLEKLEDRSKQPEDTEESVLPESMKESGLPGDLLSKINALFESIPRIEDPSLSHRATLLNKIIDESTKIGDKVLIFTQSLPTMNFINLMLSERRLKFQRIYGNTTAVERQAITKRFNTDSDQQILLISTKAGGVGLNMFGANRVVIFDFLFNPMWEEQAVGRAYRLGQTKTVFVYRFVAGGTFEENIFNKAVFKRQLAVRVVDKKNVVRQSSKNSPILLHPVKPVNKSDHTGIKGKDKVLDEILAGPYGDIILDVSVSHIQDNENDRLTEEENLRVANELKMERLKRSNPQAFEAEKKRRHDAQTAREMAQRAFEAAQKQDIYKQRQTDFVAAVQNPGSFHPTSTHRIPGVQAGLASRPFIPHSPHSLSPGMQYHSGAGQSMTGVTSHSSPAMTPSYHGQSNPSFAQPPYTPSSASSTNYPGFPQVPTNYTPSMNPLQQASHLQNQPARESDHLDSNRLAPPSGTQFPTTDGSADLVELIDLSTPRGTASPVAQPADDGDAVMDTSEDEAYEPPPPNLSVLGQ